MGKNNLRPATIGFLQTLVFLVYASGVAWLMSNDLEIFARALDFGFIAPLLLLAVFAFSAIFSAGIILGYPFYIFWEKKDFKTAAKIVVSSAVSLLIFVIVMLSILVFI